MSTLIDLKQTVEKLDEKIFTLRKEVSLNNIGSRLIEKGNSLYVSIGKSKYRYLNNDDLPLAKQLAEERYYRKLLKVLEKQKTRIEKCIKAIEKAGTEDSVYTELPKKLKSLITPDEYSAEGYAVIWQTVKHNHKYPSVNSQYYTLKGEHVRSKSELIIADRLNVNGIPYHYETAMSFSGVGLQYPDFRVLNKRTCKEMFWEHFGMMDNPEYCRETIDKLVNYAAEGCVLGRNLIVSFESSGRPLSTRYIDNLINEYLK